MKKQKLAIIFLLIIVLSANIFTACSIPECDHSFVIEICDELDENGQRQHRTICRICDFEKPEEVSKLESNTSSDVESADSVSSITVEETWESITENAIKIEAINIINHTHKEEQKVLIEGIIDNITETTFDVWLPHDGTYHKISGWNYTQDLSDYQNGNTVEICIETYNDGSLKKSNGILGIRKYDIEVVTDIVGDFKRTCSEIDYTRLMRNPENARGTMCKATGSVLQVVKTESSWQELLLTLDDGNIIYVSYHKIEGSDNILENDIVTVYGIFYITETYHTVLGVEKTVPKLSVEYIDIH